MTGKRPSTQVYPPRIRELIARGEARPARERMNEVLARIGPLEGPISDAGTRALQEQRGDVA